MPRLLLLPVDPLPNFARLRACEVPGHQLYAVERWFLDRSRALALLVVYTGHPDHSVVLDVYHTDDPVLFAATLAALRADGARPKQTEHGTLMVTSLAHFRSDYTIVPIPHGRFVPDVRDRLYASIDLLRIGASGRTALTLEDPTEPTKDRFAALYHVPTGPDSDVVSAVLRLVTLVQSALAIFGLYPHPIDGLLCDATLTAVRLWTATIGTPCLDLAPLPDKPTLDPSIVAGLLSLVLCSRNRLADLGYPLPSDPFLRPSVFFPPLSLDVVHAIRPLLSPTTDLPAFVAHILRPPSSTSADSLDHLNSLPTLTALWAPSCDGAAARSTEEESDFPRHAFRWKGKLGSWAGLAKRKHQSVDLNAPLLPPIPPPKGKKSKQSATSPTAVASTRKRPRRAPRRSTIANVPEKSIDQNDDPRAQSPTLPPMGFFGEPEDDDLLTSGQVSPLSDTQSRPNPFHLYYQSSLASPPPTSSNLQPPSTRPSISSRQSSTNTKTNTSLPPPPPQHTNPMIDEKVLSKLLLDSKQRQKKYQSTFGPQARIASWAGPIRSAAAAAVAEAPGVEGEDDENELEEQESDTGGMYHRHTAGSGRLLPNKSGKGSTVSALSSRGEGATTNAATTKPGSTSTPRLNKRKEKARFHSLLSVVGGDRQLHEEVALGAEAGGSSGVGSEDEWERERGWYRDIKGSGVEPEDEGDAEGQEEEFDEEEEERMEMLGRRTRAFDPKRRRSFHDLDTFRGVDVLSPERMNIDVELCGQCLIMWRREHHLRNVLDCVHHISTSLATSNISLRNHISKHHTSSHLSSLTSQSSSSLALLPIPAADEMTQKSERFRQGTNVLRYETEQFGVKELWAAASAMRRKVWDLRDGLFGSDAAGGGQHRHYHHHDRLPPVLHGAHGSFNRLQWRLDGRAVLVDRFGRTESEAAEEAFLDAELLEVSGAGNGASTAEVESPSPAPGNTRAFGEQVHSEEVAAAAGALSKELPEGEEEETVESRHPGIKPVWLLKFFTTWRARWSNTAVAASSPLSAPTTSAESGISQEAETSVTKPNAND